MSELEELLNGVLVSGKSLVDAIIAEFAKQQKYFEELLQTANQRIKDLENENKALKLVAGSHSMSELRRLQTQVLSKYEKPTEDKNDTEIS